MKKQFILITALVVAGGWSLANAGNVEKGKALFESPTLGGGTTGKSCQSCHKEGKNLGADLFERKHYRLMGMAKSSVAEIVNTCIEKPMGGKAIDLNGEEMQDLLAYMQTLTAKQAKTKQASKVEGC